ncbi:MAG: TlyA family RNA methyltransferase [Chlamydiae bacterium]|nr:TlyA family RNA methyltransferase [Chlamydiota bacterium]MBI3276145.1 TlyA family RNA methyltransferase [Chlamydiota bacterium]
MPKKHRIDQILVQRSFFESRTDAQKAVLAGFVKASSQIVKKSNQLFDLDIPIEILQKKKYVSRGGDKLEAALHEFQINPEGDIALDVGSSTGGFTDCLLQKGAKKVYAVDVGHDQFHYELRKNPKVIVLEKVNARYLEKKDFPEKFNLITIDVSFISLEKILPAVLPLLAPGGKILTLVKPQFEVGQECVGKGGVVRSQQDRLDAVQKVRDFSKTLPLEDLGMFQSPLKGPAGNIEYFIYLKKN